MRAGILLFALGAVRVAAAAGVPQQQGPDTVSATHSNSEFGLQNRAVGVTWEVSPGGIRNLVVTNRLDGTKVPIAKPFSILLKNGTIYDTESLIPSGATEKREIAPRPDTARAADKLHGEEFELSLESSDHAIQVKWSVVVLDGSNYVRQQLTITAAAADAPISRVELIDLDLKGAAISGSVPGSPIVAGSLFLGFEDPLSKGKVTKGRATAWVERDLPLRAGQSITYSSVIGVARPGQMRRDFLAYVEQERAHPYRTFLHYNSWYDLGYFTPYDQAGVLDRVNAFGRELTEKRGVKLDSFLFDDGWDNHKSLWKFNDGFPDGFTPVKSAAEKFGAAPGVWMSPWGGYSKPKQERIEFGNGCGL